MVKLRLKRVGKKNHPLYRIVAIDSKEKREGEPLEILGQYDPHKEGAEKVKINSERVKWWLDKGAIPSETVKSLLKKVGIFSVK